MRRQCGGGGLVLWYDAVTADGELRWQDTLNEQNGCFFDACGGIFTNYCWKESTPGLAALQAGPRKADVYMGALPRPDVPENAIWQYDCLRSRT